MKKNEIKKTESINISKVNLKIILAKIIFILRKFKILFLLIFLILLLGNYLLGFHNPEPLFSNTLYKNSYYLLLPFWLILVGLFRLDETRIFKISLPLFVLSVIFYLSGQLVVSEILISYVILCMLTMTFIAIYKLRNESKFE